MYGSCVYLHQLLEENVGEYLSIVLQHTNQITVVKCKPQKNTGKSTFRADTIDKQ